MKICLFGGTFDPVHKGHTAIAHAALRCLGLQQVIFVPSAVSPFKTDCAPAPYHHRLAMVALATAGEARFRISDLEAPGTGPAVPRYSIDTVRSFKTNLGSSHRLFFLTGADAFGGIARWKEATALLHECEFIVASRPGYSLADVVMSLPAGLRQESRAVPISASRTTGSEWCETLVVGGAVIHLLHGVKVPVSSTEVRATIGEGRRLTKLVEPAIAEYLKKNGVYRHPLRVPVQSGPASVSGVRHPKVLQFSVRKK